MPLFSEAGGMEADIVVFLTADGTSVLCVGGPDVQFEGLEMIEGRSSAIGTPEDPWHVLRYSLLSNLFIGG
jgi:hypothetical protein